MTSIVGIRGDGNAVGDNNRITVIKQTNNHYRGSGKNDKDPGDGGKETVGLAVLGLGVVIAAASFYFALYSETIYWVLRITAGAEVLGALLAAYFYVRNEGYSIAIKMIFVAALAVIGSVALATAHHDYPKKIIELAEASGGFQGFWCGLSIFGKQVALLHALTASLGFAVGLLFLLPVTAIGVFFGCFELPVSESAYLSLERWTSWLAIIVGGVFLFAASYFHTPAGGDTWSKFIKEPPSLLICPITK